MKLCTLHGFHLFSVDRGERTYYIATATPNGPSVACEQSLPALEERLERSHNSRWLEPQEPPLQISQDALVALRAMAAFNGEEP